jgi:hypothetical protein
LPLMFWISNFRSLFRISRVGSRILRPPLSSASLGRLCAVFEHLAAGCLAAAAFVGAGAHHLVAAVFRAGLAAAGAGLGAAATNEVAKRPAASDDLGRRRADAGPVLTRTQCLHVLHFALRHQVCAMCGAGVADPLAVVARFGAAVEHFLVGMSRSGLGPLLLHSGGASNKQPTDQGCRNCPDDDKCSFGNHDWLRKGRSVSAARRFGRAPGTAANAAEGQEMCRQTPNRSGLA